MMYRGSTRRILIPSRGCVFGLGDILGDTGRRLFSSCALVCIEVARAVYQFHHADVYSG